MDVYRLAKALSIVVYLRYAPETSSLSKECVTHESITIGQVNLFRCFEVLLRNRPD